MVNPTVIQFNPSRFSSLSFRPPETHCNFKLLRLRVFILFLSAQHIAPNCSLLSTLNLTLSLVLFHFCPGNRPWNTFRMFICTSDEQLILAIDGLTHCNSIILRTSKSKVRLNRQQRVCYSSSTDLCISLNLQLVVEF